MKKIIIFLVIVVLLGGGAFYYFKVANKSSVPGYKNTSYIIDGRYTTLKDGVADTYIGSSVMPENVRYFGNEVVGDISGDSVPDTAFVVVKQAGGSGTFYYVVLAVKKDIKSNKYTGTNAILLGDRVAPQNLEINDGKIIANYADRRLEDPMVTPPSVGVSKYIEYKEGSLVEIK